MEKHYRKFLDERNENEKELPTIVVDEESKFFFFLHVLFVQETVKSNLSLVVLVFELYCFYNVLERKLS